MPDISTKTPGNSMNSESVGVSQHMNDYDLSRPYQTSERFGVMYPHFYHFGVEKDVLNVSSSVDIRTLPMQAPQFIKLQNRSSFFVVPKSALLPINWEKVQKEPAFGDDIPSTDVGCFACHPYYIAKAYDDFFEALMRLSYSSNSSFVDTLFGYHSGDIRSFTNVYTFIMRYACLVESIMSSKSLLSSLGSPLYPFFVASAKYDFDARFTELVKWVYSRVDHFQLFNVFNGPKLKPRPDVLPENSNPNEMYVDLSTFVDYFRYAPEHIDFIRYIDPPTTDDLKPSSVFRMLGEHYGMTTSFDVTRKQFLLLEGLPTLREKGLDPIAYPRNEYCDDMIIPGFNYDPLFAYQMGCATFYNNEQTDFVLDSELFRGTMQSMLIYPVTAATADPKQVIEKLPVDVFRYNGSYYQYDALSGHNINKLCHLIHSFADQVFNSSGTPDILTNVNALMLSFDAFQNIFGFRNSLRYFDLILGGRTRAYSVGDNPISLTPDNMDAINIAKSLVYQRAKLIFSRIGNDYDDYSREVLNSYAGVDQYHEPIPLGDFSFDLSSYTVENTTSENQGNLVSAIDSTGQSFGNVTVTLPITGVVIGLNYFTAQRIYSGVTETFYRKEDRLDHFNPLLQHTGDIPLLLRDVDFRSFLVLNPRDILDKPYSYLIKDMDYKQTYPHADGAFVDRLPGWSFLADTKETYQYVPFSDNLSHDSVRTIPSEFDRFFESLSAQTEGQRFHFILNIYNSVNCSRNMLPKPELLV